MKYDDKRQQITIQGIIAESPSFHFMQPITINADELKRIDHYPEINVFAVRINTINSNNDDLAGFRITKHEYIQLAQQFFPHKLYNYIKAYDEIQIIPKFTNAILSLNDPKPIQNKLMRIQ